ncbi:MAG TPA: fatty acid desaturase [Symbiobacteriaceae bacterium]|nr:fatty acid desaturase [Symbiobacteriaceae bacterium]
MKELHPIGWYASRVAPHLPEKAFKPAPERLWGGLAYMTMAVAGIAAVGLYTLHPLVIVALSVVIGTGFAGMGFLAHEILHGTVVKTAWLRDLLGGISFLQFGVGAKLWRKWHNMEHHAHTQEEHTDPDAWATMEEFYKRPALRWVYRLPNWVRATANFTSFTFFFTVHGLLMFKRFAPEFKPRDRAVAIAQLVVPWTLWLSVLLWLGPLKFLFAYVLPIMMANFLVICYIATNHQLNPLTDVNDPLANSLSVSAPWLVHVLHMNFGYHTEHHLFPGMNPKWAPLVQAEILRQWPDRYHVMPWVTALATLARTPRIYHNQTELVDPHRMWAYGSLGHGLDPAAVRARATELEAEPGEVPFGFRPQEGD